MSDRLKFKDEALKAWHKREPNEVIHFVRRDAASPNGFRSDGGVQGDFDFFTAYRPMQVAGNTATEPVFVGFSMSGEVRGALRHGGNFPVAIR